MIQNTSKEKLVSKNQKDNASKLNEMQLLVAMLYAPKQDAKMKKILAKPKQSGSLSHIWSLTQ